MIIQNASLKIIIIKKSIILHANLINMIRKIFSIFNFHTIIIIAEAVGVYYLFKHIDLTMSVNFDIISIAIIFPLVFTITGAFNKRQESLNYLSIFRTKLITLQNIFGAVEGVTKKDKEKLSEILINLEKYSFSLLKGSKRYTITGVRKFSVEIYDLTLKNLSKFNEREKDSMIRVKNEIFQNIENLHALQSHGTPVSLRSYCLVFIYLFPLIYTPSLIDGIKSSISEYQNIISLGFTILISFTLIALYNIQNYIENPFDQKGFDDVKLKEFKLKEEEI